jgi:hypothetical protein
MQTMLVRRMSPEVGLFDPALRVEQDRDFLFGSASRRHSVVNLPLAVIDRSDAHRLTTNIPPAAAYAFKH